MPRVLAVHPKSLRGVIIATIATRRSSPHRAKLLTKTQNRAKNHRLKKRRMPNGRANLQDVLLVAVPQTGADFLEAGVSKDVEGACADSSTTGVSKEVQEVGVNSLSAGVSMEVQEVDDDSGDDMCRFFVEKAQPSLWGRRT